MRTNRFVSHLSILVSAFVFALPAQSQYPVRMNEIVEARIAGSGFMGSVLVARGDEILLNEGYGFANLEGGSRTLPIRSSGSVRLRSSLRRRPF